MPNRQCPLCHTDTARLIDDRSKIARVWYYRCSQCGHLWHVLKPDGPISHAKPPPKE